MRKSSLITRLKLTTYFLFRKDRKDLQVMTCEYCGSLNIKKIPETQGQAYTDTMKVWSHEYKCQKCGAECYETQKWFKVINNAVKEDKPIE